MSPADTALADELERLLAEPVDAARHRRLAAFEEVSAGRELVLYGAGGHGRTVLAALRARGVEPRCFADAAPSADRIDDLPVLEAASAARLHGDDAAWVNCVFNATDSDASVRASLTGLGCRTVLSWILLAWAYPEGLLPAYAVDLPEGVLEQANSVRAAFALLADDDSREEYLAQVRWRLWADSDHLPTPLPVEESYFTPSVVAPLATERFVDCGAFDGDTLEAFLTWCGGAFSGYVALEPDPANLELLQTMLAALPRETTERVVVLPVAAAREQGVARWRAGAVGAALAADGTLEVPTAPLDDLLAEHETTYIKLDIEGGEPDALTGAAGIIRRDQPVLGVCAYHAQDHLWSIPLQVHELAPDHRLHLRRYEQDGYQVVLYAVPPGRVRQS